MEGLDLMMGFENKKEVFNLWFEVTFLRLCVNRILELNPQLKENLTQECYDKSRQEAMEIVQKRFPNFKIEFVSVDKQEDSCCTSPDLQESPDVSALPLNEA